ncbi:15766_t:CDS:2 [Dentiscutata erythropus]|uniref:15766_t:CDS:1 n=1 Tax=Dentiscutata erythropus TaxID=1348616 RepID=A0A9N9FFG6_9GLOM|nr:15766_t:CDS:2 [Dentiscutata erythropus]
MPLFQRKSSPNLLNEKMSLVNNIDCIDNNFGSENRSLTCSFSELPHWLQDNVDIITGYRRPTYSYIKCVRSLFYLHNESVNIWSHLVGAVIFIIILITTYFSLSAYSSITPWDFVVQYSFLVGVLLCLTFSTLFHSFMCHSEMISVAIAPQFRTPEFRWFRTTLFIALGL